MLIGLVKTKNTPEILWGHWFFLKRYTRYTDESCKDETRVCGYNEDKVEKRRGGNSINIDRLSKTKNTTRCLTVVGWHIWENPIRTDVMLEESQALKLVMPSKLYSNFLQDKVKKRRGGNPIDVNRFWLLQHNILIGFIQI